MTAMEISDWGFDITDGAYKADFWAPIMPGCDEYMNKPASNQKISARMFGTADEDCITMMITVQDISPTSKVIPLIDPNADWDDTYAGAMMIQDYPNEPNPIDEEHPPSAYIPYVQGAVTIYQHDGATGTDAMIYALEIGTRSDVAYSGDYLELTDYTAGASYSADAAAASWMLKRLVANPYNVISQDAAFRMNVAVPASR